MSMVRIVYPSDIRLSECGLGELTEAIARIADKHGLSIEREGLTFNLTKRYVSKVTVLPVRRPNPHSDLEWPWPGVGA